MIGGGGGGGASPPNLQDVIRGNSQLLAHTQASPTCACLVLFQPFSTSVQTCKERDELSDRVSSLKEMVRSLETELQNSTTALNTISTEASKYRSKVSLTNS